MEGKEIDSAFDAAAKLALDILFNNKNFTGIVVIGINFWHASLYFCVNIS